VSSTALVANIGDAKCVLARRAQQDNSNHGKVCDGTAHVLWPGMLCCAVICDSASGEGSLAHPLCAPGSYQPGLSGWKGQVECVVV
jgi:hypothetical protein